MTCCPVSVMALAVLFWGYVLTGLSRHIAARVAERHKELTAGLDERRFGG